MLTLSDVPALSKIISNHLGDDLKNDAVTLVKSVITRNELNIGIRENSLIKEFSCKLSSFCTLEGDTSVIGNRFKPLTFNHNNYDLYFTTREILSNNSKKNYLAILGETWYNNEGGSEFVEAVVFCSHNIQSLNCMLATIKINKNVPRHKRMYLCPGSIVSVIYDDFEFNDSDYLIVSTCMNGVFLSNEKNNKAWNIIDLKQIHNL